ncbi:MAG TPA: hypothetical protein PKN47_01780 [Nitrospira sp.]|nr:hypothetical protein [Nitrospira sp.]
MKTSSAVDRRDWPVGTAVVVTLDDGSQLHTTTCSEPWQLGHGEWVVKVAGIGGGYALKRVRVPRKGERL